MVDYLINTFALYLLAEWANANFWFAHRKKKTITQYAAVWYLISFHFMLIDIIKSTTVKKKNVDFGRFGQKGWFIYRWPKSGFQFKISIESTKISKRPSRYSLSSGSIKRPWVFVRFVYIYHYWRIFKVLRLVTRWRFDCLAITFKKYLFEIDSATKSDGQL